MAAPSKSNAKDLDKQDFEERSPDSMEQQEECAVPGYLSINDFTQKSLQCILQATKRSNDLPLAGDDFDYFTSYTQFQELMNIEGEHILHVIQNILKYESVRGDRSVTSKDLDIDDKFDYLTDANDQILERVSNSLDEACGIRKEEPLIVVSASKPGTSASWNKQSGQGKKRNYSMFAARNIERPQLTFKDTLTNDNLPFCPSLKEKPHAVLSLRDSMKFPPDVSDEVISSPNFQYPHPYQHELDNFKPPDSQLERKSPKMPSQCSQSPELKMIETSSQLERLIEDLKQQTAIAVDLEHHSYRSFLGFTCLIQISSPSQDYIIDAIRLRSDLHRLNIIFTDPRILKVFHGAESDVQWLQRDFSLYLVNMFDTGIAARMLQMPRLSLAYLLDKYCSVTANKQYQMADWRIRPLPQELLDYAREDTHYLLYIHECLHNELLDRGNDQENMLLSLYSQSTQRCLNKYQKPIFSEQSYFELYKKNRKVFNAQQLYALQALYSWRDGVARAEDESTGYILPSHMLMQISDILPRESAGVLACCNPTPPLVRQCINEIHSFVLKAREIALNKPKPTPPSKPSPQKPLTSPANIDDIINSCHDSTPRPDRQYLNDLDYIDMTDSSLVKASSHLFQDPALHAPLIDGLDLDPSTFFSAICHTQIRSRKKQCQEIADRIRASFVSPFAMYLPVSGNNGLKRTNDDKNNKDTLKSPSWKLKPSATKRKSEETSAKEENDETHEKIQQADVKPEADGVLSLSQMFPRKKKQKRADTINIEIAAIATAPVATTEPSALGDEDAPAGEPEVDAADLFYSKRGKKNKGKPMKKKMKSERFEASDVKPYDYGSIDTATMFSKKANQSFGSRGRERGRGRGRGGRGNRGGQKGNAFRPDVRSYTFTARGK